MSLDYFQGDTLPAWDLAIPDATDVDFSAGGWEFLVTLAKDGTTVLQKDSGLLGQAGGHIQVQWEPTDLDLPTAYYNAHLKATNDDGGIFTLDETIVIRPNHGAIA